MSDSRSSVQLPDVSKEMLKNLAKQAEKEKRNQGALIRPPTFGVSKPTSVSFDAPVKVSEVDEDQKRLKKIIGSYEAVSRTLVSGKHRELMGVERQPPTPLPSRHPDGVFFPKPESTRGHPKKLYDRQSDNGPQSRPSPSKQEHRGQSVPSKDVIGKMAGPSSGVSSAQGCSVDKTSLYNSAKPQQSEQKLDSKESANSQKVVKSAKSDYSNQSTKPVSHSAKHQTAGREPVLSTINQELKVMSNQLASSSNRISSNQMPGYKGSERTESKSSSDPLSVLKVKEDNRNGAVFNGGRTANRPQLRIEKNVEAMLEELTTVPQPLTEIQTPLKAIKNPFQQESKSASELSSKGGSGMVSNKTLPTKTERGNEDKTDKESSNEDSSEDSGSDSDEDKDDDDDDDEGEIKSDSENEADVASKVTAVEQVPGPIPVPAPGSQAAPVKEQRRRTVSSSDSSSSSSESSGSGSESESENEVSEEEQPESPHQKEKTTPAKDKSSPDYMDTTPSPSRNWGLRSFLQSKDQNPQLISMNTKQLPCEAPPSNKSDPDQFDEVNDVKRPADHISDENQPSVDEFSPPPPIDTKIPILSPLKSPQAIKSPAKRTIHRTSVAERLNNSIETPPPYKDTYTNVKNRERKTSLSKPSPEITDTVKGKTKRGRKSRPKVPKSKPIVNDDSSMSECDSDVDVVNNSLSSDNGVFSPKKSLPVSPKKSGFPLGHSSLCSPKSLSSASRKKESKRDKLLREKEIVKLKQERVSPESVPNKVHCDKNLNVLSSAQSGPPEADSIEKILHSFPEKEPLSPIPNMPDLCQNLESLCKAGLAVTPIKPLPLNGSVSYKNGKPSVWVKLDLSLIKKFVSFNKNSSDILHLKPLLSVTPNNISPKHQKLTSGKSGAVSSKVSPSGRTTSSANSSKQCEYASEQIASEAEGHKPSVPESVSERSNKNSAIPDFNSLPVRQKKQQEKLSDASSSDSSDSESDSGAEESKSAYISPPPSSAIHSSFPQSSPDKKKRKLVSHTEGDTKRRKTVRSKSPHKQSEPKEEISLEEIQSNRKKVSVKRERHPSTSSQHSTHSTLSQHSTHSHHSSHSYKHKRVKVGESTPSHDLKPSSTPSSVPTSAGRSAERLATSSSASSAPSKHPIKLEVPVETAKYNGYSQQSVPSEPSHDSQPPWRLKVKNENEVFLSADEYHQKAKKYKHQADAMEPCLARYMLYMESVLSFIQSGCAMERNHMIADAANMYKDTYKIITHQYHQFRAHADPDAVDKSESKLTVLCVRIQSLVYLKLYMLKRNDNMKMKSILEDHYNKSVKTTSHPKPPSAPSPHQTNWNRSTGTPSPMSPTPSPANSVCSVGSVGSDATPSKMTNGTSNSTPIAPPGSVIVPQRIDSIARKYFAITNYMVVAHELWEQANSLVTPDIREYFAQLDYECGPLTITSGLNHLVKYVRQGIANVKKK